jgi:hypothetical protein
MVGLLGNIIILYCFDRYRDQALEEDPTRTPKAVHAAILESNFVKHTLPMIVSAILLFACPMLTYKESRSTTPCCSPSSFSGPFCRSTAR